MTQHKLTRRTLLAAPLALALPRALFAQGQTFDFDCVVIGAGAAGLAAAHELRRRKKTFAVLEARSRPGGRIYTDRTLGAPYDAGAFYLHWAEKNPLTRIARAIGVKTLDEDDVERFFQSHDRGNPPASAQGQRDWSARRALLDEEGREIPDVSLMQFAGGGNAPAAEGALVMARLALGEEAERVSARDYSRLIAGEDRLIPEGFGKILERHARGLPITYDAPVSAIDWSGPGIAITSPRGTITARTLIVTTSVGVLQSGAIRFTPALPHINRDGLAGLAMGASTRAALDFGAQRFGLKPNTSLRLRLSPRESISFGCFPFGNNIVTAYFGGDHARKVSNMSEADASAYLLDHFVSIIGEDARRHFRAGRFANWWQDPYARGGYSHALPGQADARAKLATPVASRMFFAGEATGGAFGEQGAAITAGGAYLAGQAAARAV